MEEHFLHVLPVNFDQEKRPYLAEEDFDILKDCPSNVRNCINEAFMLADDLDDLRPAFQAYKYGRIPGKNTSHNMVKFYDGSGLETCTGLQLAAGRGCTQSARSRVATPR